MGPFCDGGDSNCVVKHEIGDAVGESMGGYGLFSVGKEDFCGGYFAGLAL